MPPIIASTRHLLSRAAVYTRPLAWHGIGHLSTSVRRRAVLSGSAAMLLGAHSFLSLVACASTSEALRQNAQYSIDTTQRKVASSTKSDDPPTWVTAQGRIVAVGDLHGDLEKSIRAFELAGVLKMQDDRPIWVGGNTVVVQLGDVLDRGDDEIAIILLIRELDKQARAEGGAVYMLNGNHESLNICGDFRYVTPGAFFESALAAGIRLTEQEAALWRQHLRSHLPMWSPGMVMFREMSQNPRWLNDTAAFVMTGMRLGLTQDEAALWQRKMTARLALWLPGGGMARELAKNPTVLVVNDTVFAHGGLLPAHVAYGIERMNHEVAAWMRGDVMEDGGLAKPPFLAMGNSSSVMWNRALSSHNIQPLDRIRLTYQLKQALVGVGAKRLVVGHTPQAMGINPELDDMVWRVDVGMSYGVLNGPVQVLEVLPSQGDGDAQVNIIDDYRSELQQGYELESMFDL